MKPIRQWTKADIIDFYKKVDKKTWLRIAGLAVGAAVILFGMIWPAWISRIDVRQQIRDHQGRILIAQGQMRKKPEWLKQKEEYRKFILDSKGRIYGHGETSRLLGVISKLAGESKVGIIASQPKVFEGKLPEPFAKQYQAELYDLTVEGNYHDMGNFIAHLESYPKMLRIRSFRISPRTDSPKACVAEVTLSVVSFKEGVPP